MSWTNLNFERVCVFLLQFHQQSEDILVGPYNFKNCLRVKT